MSGAGYRLERSPGQLMSKQLDEQDQHSNQGRTAPHVQPDTLPAQEIEHPGSEADMDVRAGLRWGDLSGQRPA
jgi:hypothetical protein